MLTCGQGWELLMESFQIYEKKQHICKRVLNSWCLVAESVPCLVTICVDFLTLQLFGVPLFSFAITVRLLISYTPDSCSLAILVSSCQLEFHALLFEDNLISFYGIPLTKFSWKNMKIENRKNIPPLVEIRWYLSSFPTLKILALSVWYLLLWKKERTKQRF